MNANTIILPKEYMWNVYDREIQLLQEEKRATKDVMFTPPQPLTKRCKYKGKGAYIISHRVSGEVVYVGQGNVDERRVQHLRIFNYKGKKKLYTSKEGSLSSVDSPVGRKMYNVDNNPNNWLFQYVKLASKVLNEVESGLILRYNPIFNRKTKDKPKVMLTTSHPFFGF